MTVKTTLVLAILILMLGFGTAAVASLPPINLSDGNSSVTIDPYSPSGVFEWTVELTNHMAQSSYWYRIGGEGIAAPLSALSIDHIDQSSTEAMVFYSGTDFSLQILYSLTGGDPGSGTSDIAETVMVTNKTGSAMSFHLFEYVNLNLLGTADGQTVAFDSDSASVFHSKGTTIAQLSSIPGPNYWEIGEATALLNKLNNESFGDLSNVTTSHSGDAAFALQWSRVISAYGTSGAIGQDLLLEGAPVPEPGSLVALLSGLGLIPALKRRRH